MRAACSASPVICVRHKRRTDRGAHACGRCALRQAGCSLFSWGSRLLSWGGARCDLRFALPRTACAFGCGRCVLGCVGCARGGARCVGACGGFVFRQAGCSFLSSGGALGCGGFGCFPVGGAFFRPTRTFGRGGFAFRQAGCSFLSWGGAFGCGGFGCFPVGGAFLRPARAFACGGFAFRPAGCSLLASGDARCALRSALPRTACAFGCGRCALGGARSGGLERGPLCRPGEAQCADGRPTVAPREPTPRQGEIARCQRRDDARCLVPPSACAPRLPSTLPPCRAVCGCAAGGAEGSPSTFPPCAAGWADRIFALPPCRAVCGCAARVAEGTPSTFATGAAGWVDRTFALPPCRAVCGCAARVAEGPPSTFAPCAAGWADRTFALPPCRAVCGGHAFAVPDGRRRGARFSFTTSIFFQMSTLIRLRRTAHLPGGTEGVLFFPAESGQSSMATLEPPASGAHPAIPAGEYPLRLDVVSPRFARSPRRWSAAWGARLPRLMQVPGREGILIHPGNRPSDSSGCVLIGRAVSPLRLGESVATFHRLMHALHRLPPPLRLRVED